MEDPRHVLCPACKELLPHFQADRTPYSCDTNAYCVLCAAAPVATGEPPLCRHCVQWALTQAGCCKVLSNHSLLQRCAREFIYELDPLLCHCRDCQQWCGSFLEEGTRVCEDYYVTDALWDAVCPDDNVITADEGTWISRSGKFVLCVGCFERRLGRQLMCEDFGWDKPRRTSPRAYGRFPGPSRRLRERYATARDGTKLFGL